VFTSQHVGLPFQNVLKYRSGSIDSISWHARKWAALSVTQLADSMGVLPNGIHLGARLNRFCFIPSTVSSDKPTDYKKENQNPPRKKPSRPFSDSFLHFYFLPFRHLARSIPSWPDCNSQTPKPNQSRPESPPWISIMLICIPPSIHLRFIALANRWYSWTCYTPVFIEEFPYSSFHPNARPPSDVLPFPFARNVHLYAAFLLIRLDKANRPSPTS